MGILKSRPARAWLCAGLAGALMCGVSTAALAAPDGPVSTDRDGRDARYEAMQRQLDDFRAQLEAMKANGAPDAHMAAMQAQLDALAQQLADLKSQQDAALSDIQTLKTPTGGSVIASLPNGRPVLATADGRFTANLHAIVMFDAGKSFVDTNSLPASTVGRDLNSGTNFRRARLGIDGKLFKDFDYGFVLEFGGSGAEDAGHIQEAWLQYSAFKPWRIRLGAFEPNIVLAAAVSTSQMPLMERPSPAEVARNVAAGDSRSALQLAGNGVFGAGDSGLAMRWFLSTAVTGNTVGTINSTGSATAQPVGEQQAVIGRFAIAPFQSTNWQAHFGVNAQYVIHPNDSGAANAVRYPIQLRDRPELRIDATRLVDTGGIDARHASVLGAEAGFTAGPFMAEGEYFHYEVNRRLEGPGLPSDPSFHGWYVQGVWVLTGENRPYNPTEARFDAPKPNYNFNPSAGTWGAFELAARYSDLDLNYHDCGAGVAIPVSPAPCFDAIRGGEQKIASFGVNWYMNPTIRFMFDFQHVMVDRLSASGAQIGQDYNAIGFRSQFAF